MKFQGQFGIEDRSIWVWNLMKALRVPMGIDTWCAMMSYYTSIEQSETAVAIFNEHFVDGSLEPTDRVYEELMLAYLAVRDIDNVQIAYHQMRSRGITPSLACGELLVRALLLRDDTLQSAFDLADHIAQLNGGFVNRRLLQDMVASCARLPRAKALAMLDRILHKYQSSLCEESLSLAINVARVYGDGELEIDLWWKKRELHQLLESTRHLSNNNYQQHQKNNFTSNNHHRSATQQQQKRFDR